MTVPYLMDCSNIVQYRLVDPWACFIFCVSAIGAEFTFLQRERRALVVTNVTLQSIGPAVCIMRKRVKLAVFATSMVRNIMQPF